MGGEWGEWGDVERREEEEASLRTTDSWTPDRCPKRKDNFLSAQICVC